MQVGALVPAHVVWFARIYKEVGLCAHFNALLQEIQAVLWHHNGIVHTCYYLQFSFQILGLRQQTALGIALRIVLWSAHIAFAIHYFVPLPIDNGTASNAYLEYFGMTGDERGGHKSAEAPSVNAHAVFVNVG